MQGNAQDEEHVDPHGECHHEIKKLSDALKAIEGGSFPGASNYVLAGDWKGAYGELQRIAREALPVSLGDAVKAARKAATGQEEPPVPFRGFA